MAQINKPTDYFNSVLYTGNGSTQTITGVGFQPDLVWLKNRSNNLWWHTLVDAVRGAGITLASNVTNSEFGTGSNLVPDFDPDGFDLNVNPNDTSNENSSSYVAWNWKAGGTPSSNTDGSITSSVSASTTSGFSIVSYTGNGTNPSTIGHGLGAKPDLMIVKSRDDADAWLVGTDKISGWNWSNDYFHLNAASAKMTDAGGTAFNTAPTSSVFSVGAYLNGSGEDYIAYCFAEKKGFSKFGSYAGNTLNDGTFVYTGFKPAFVMIKGVTTATSWIMFDNKREPSNPTYKRLHAELIDAEYTTAYGIDMLSNGFKFRTSDNSFNHANTYMYIAFAAEPLVGTNNIPSTAR